VFNFINIVIQRIDSEWNYIVFEFWDGRSFNF